jgi:Ni/Co efflux regulator RcnB
LVSSSDRKISPALAGKFIAVAVACAGLAAKLKVVQQQTSFPTKHRVEHTCEPCWRSNYEICTHHCQGSGRNRNLAGKGRDFWSGRHCSVCRLSSCRWEQGSYFAESWQPRL